MEIKQVWRPYVLHATSGGWISHMQSNAGHECLCADMQGWNMGLRDASMSFPESAAALDRLIDERVEGELKVGLSSLTLARIG